MKKATFAGGCFWCMQPPFNQLKGVLSTTVGYTGGTQKNPTYEEVCTGLTGHAEAIEIVFDPSKISFRDLLTVFWSHIDPTTSNQQFADVGTQYRTAIFYHDEEQKKEALESKRDLEKSGRFSEKIVTEIVPAQEFYKAEGYHQCYYQKNPAHYQAYKIGSGRESYLKRVWGENPPVSSFQLRSPAFQNNGLIPSQYACDGKNISPPLQWSSPPNGTKSFALVVEDPDAPSGTWIHWVLFNVPVTMTELKENFPKDSQIENGIRQGRTDFNRIGYGGPCPPSGIHRYYFKIYALDSFLTLEAGSTKIQLEKAMRGKIVAQTELLGLYQRNR